MNRRSVLMAGAAMAAAAGGALMFRRGVGPEHAWAETFEVDKSEAEWRKILTPEQFTVLRKQGTERAGSLSGRDHTRKKLNQFRAKWLVQVIGKSATHFFVIPRCKRRGNRTCVRTVFYRSNTRYL